MLNDYSINDEKANTGEANFQANIATWHPSGIVQNEPKDINDVLGGQPLSWDTPLSICAITSFLCSTHKLYQEKPRKKSSKPGWRNYTHSLESCENAVRKQYIIMMLNFMYTQKFPNFHVIIGFHNPMQIKDFCKMRNKAFGHLAKNGVKAYYVHEPSKDGGLHIHQMVIYDGDADNLRALIKEALEKAGLKPRQDFHVNVKSAVPTFEGYKGLCAYILKFNGKRTNPRTPRLFLTGLKIRKVGMIGKWFAKPKRVIWEEYREAVKQKHEKPVERGNSAVQANYR